MFHTISRGSWQLQRRYLHTNFPSNGKHSSYDCFNFILGFTNCIIISSVLWGFESYNEKLKMIEDTNIKINELLVSYRVLEKQCKRYITKDRQNQPPQK